MCSICNVPISQKKKKKEQWSDIFWTTCTHLPHLTPTTHLTNLSTLFGRPSLSSHLFSFFFSQTHKHSLTFSHRYLHATISTNIFSGNVTGKSLGTSKHLHLLFEIKFLILLVSFIFCLRLYFYLSFNNNTPMIYEH